MFGLCGKSAKYEDGNVDEENKLILDLLIDPKVIEKKDFYISVNHEELKN